MVQYIFRNRKAGFSIAKVFNTFIPYIKDKRVMELPCERASAASILKNLLFLVRHKQNDCLYHLTGNVEYCSLLLPKRYTILTIHDLVLINHNNYGKVKRCLFYYLWHYYPFKRARIITCISQATKKELLSFFPWVEKKIVIIPNPVDSCLEYVKKEFNKECPTILHIGTRENKNLDRVAEALKGITCTLRVIGELSECQKLTLVSNNIHYVNIFNISDEEIRREYYNCDIVSFPSTYEGFGMPILEGFASGRIIVTSNLEPMNDISEDASYLVNPYDVESIRQGFLNAIENDIERENKIRRGREIVGKYSASNIAMQYQNIYDSIQ